MREAAASASDYYVCTSMLTGIERAISALGGNPGECLHDLHWSQAHPAYPGTYLAYRRVAAVLENIARDLDCPDFGLRFADSIADKFYNIGTIMYAAMYARTLRDAVDMAIRLLPACTNAVRLDLLEDPGDGNARLRVSFPGLLAAGRQSSEFQLAIMLRFAKSITRLDDLQIRQVRFQHSRPRRTTTHERIFGCSLEFDAEHYELVFDRSLLAIGFPERSHCLRLIVGDFVRHQVERAPLAELTASQTVRLALNVILGAGRSDMAHVAHALSVSEKRLQRMLSQEGTSFSEIVEERRLDRAIRMLSQTSAPLRDIARATDYTSVSAFSLAFKRWTGSSPGAWRNARRLNCS